MRRRSVTSAVNSHYRGSARGARVWQRNRAATSVGAFIPLSFAPGEAYQFDWSHEVVLINGTTLATVAPDRGR
jgi:hypothetical protein